MSFVGELVALLGLTALSLQLVGAIRLLLNLQRTEIELSLRRELYLAAVAFATSAPARASEAVDANLKIMQAVLLDSERKVNACRRAPLVSLLSRRKRRDLQAAIGDLQGCRAVGRLLEESFKAVTRYYAPSNRPIELSAQWG